MPTSLSIRWRTARRPSRPELPRRFYKTAAVAPHEGGFVLTLDGKPARTPGKNPLVVASPAVAEALAAEWGRQGERIDPATMPLTRIVQFGDRPGFARDGTGEGGNRQICR